MNKRDGGATAARWWRAARGRAVARGTALWGRVSARPGAAHLLRAGQRFADRLGSQFAAAITYFSFLSLVPIVMVGFSAAGFVLSSRPDWLTGLKSQVTAMIPGALADSVGGIIDQAVEQRLTVGIVGLAIALYSGLNWMGNVRDAVRAQWRPRWEREKKAQENFFMRYLLDLMSLAGLLLAILVSFALTALGTAAQDLVVRWLGIDAGGLMAVVLQVGPFLVSTCADVLIFGWVYSVLPNREYRADRRTLVIGSLVMAVCFEILKAALTLLVTRMSSSPSGVVFGAVIGLLLFFNLVARAFLIVAAWMATAERQSSDVQRPSP
ncbi:MAG: inner membrane protein YhjD [Actinobacteria bacterium 69-20]|nr:inner membrane protein YhjD [Actinomycetota bacterium]OJV23914.1 MAG: inner membrane protein YhjD [Actinobacteria bacterium 69-20]